MYTSIVYAVLRVHGHVAAHGHRGLPAAPRSRPPRPAVREVAPIRARPHVAEAALQPRIGIFGDRDSEVSLVVQPAAPRAVGGLLDHLIVFLGLLDDQVETE